MNVGGSLDRRFPQNGYTSSPRPEVVDDNFSHAQGDGSANPVAVVKSSDDAGPPLGGFKPFDKKPSSPRPGASNRPADVFGPPLRTQHSPRPDAHPAPDFIRTELAYPAQNLPLRPAYSEDIYRPPTVEDTGPVRSVSTFSLPPRPANDGSANLETIPDNKERPDLETRGGRFPAAQHGAWFDEDEIHYCDLFIFFFQVW